MKKTYKLLIVLIASAIVVFTCTIIHHKISTHYTMFRFDQETLGYAFSDEVSSAQSFCETKGANTILYGRYKYAKANDDGTLTIIVDDETLRLWKSSDWTLQILQSLLEEKEIDIGVDIDWSDDFLSAKRKVKECGVEISEDYSLITQGPGDDGSFYTFLLPACVYMQIFEGKQVGEIKVTYVEVDEKGNIIDEINWELDSSNKS